MDISDIEMMNTKQWTFAVVETEIKRMLIENETFTNVKKYFAPTSENEMRILLSLYTQLLLDSLHQKGREFIQKLLDASDENVITQWIDVVYSNKSDIGLLKLTKQADFNRCLEDLNPSTIDLTNFCRDLRKTFRELLVENTDQDGLIGIYRLLLYCERYTKHSSIYYKAIKELEKKLQYDNTVLHLETDPTADVKSEHQQLLEMVKNYEPKTASPVIKNLIMEMFKKTSTTIQISAENPKKLEVEGYKIFMSIIYDDVLHRIKQNTNIEEIEINAKDDLIWDTDTVFQEKNLTLIAKNRIVLVNPVTCDLSGRSAINDEQMPSKIETEKPPGENGVDGRNGIAGKSSGNIVICAKEFDGQENLTLILNGGNGSNGHDGGDGAAGEDGVGADYDKVFGYGHTFRKTLKHVTNKITFAVVSRLMDNKMVTSETTDGIVHEQSDSAHYSSTHSFEFWYGSDGKPGGKGGKNGCSGEGGKQGKFDLLLNGEYKDYKTTAIQVKACDGKDGHPGIPGKNGEFGKDGWDVAMLWKTGKGPIYYGESKDLKFTITYSDTETDESVYVREQDVGEGSKCYAQIEKTKCTNKFLQEKRTEFKSDSERSGEAIAVKTAAIDINAVAQKHQAISLTFSTEMVEEVQQINWDANEESQIGRIMELWEPQDDYEYTPKIKNETPILDAKYLENLDINNSDNLEPLWNSASEETLKEFIKSAADNAIKIKLQKKEIINKMRLLKKELKTVNINPKSLKFDDDIKIGAENYPKYCKMYNLMKKLLVNGKSINFYMNDIENAFNKLENKKSKKLLESLSEKLSSDTLINCDFGDPAFEDILQKYEKIPEEIKSYPIKIFFYYTKLHEYLFDSDAANESHNAISDQDTKLNTISKTFFILEKTRMKYTRKFLKKLKEAQEKLKCAEENILLQEMDNIDILLQKLFTYPSLKCENGNYLYKELNFLCNLFPEICTTFLNTLLLVFESEGCHIDLITLKYLIDTVFIDCKNNGIYNCNIFPGILLPSKQEEWIDECFVFNAETALGCIIKNKKQLFEALKNIFDENLKILLSEMLHMEENHLTEEELLKLLTSMKDATTLFPHLKEIPLSQWTKIMEEISLCNNIKSPEFLVLPKESKTLILFWASRLMEKFKSKNVNDIIDQLIKFIPYDRIKVNRFMQRLNSNDTAYNLVEQSLDEILRTALNQLSSSSFDKNKTLCYQITEELLDSKSQELEVQHLKKLFNNLNDNFNIEFVEYLDLLSASYNNETENAIKNCIQFLASGVPVFYDVKQKFEEEYQACSNNIDYDVFLLKIIDEVVHQKRKFYLRHTQKAAVLSAIKNYKKTKGMLQQISTGEGKTLIIAALSIICAFKSLTINIITSSSVLAKRDVSNTPNGCLSLYNTFGLTADHICYDSARRREKVYSKSNIIYGDLASYQRDYLMDAFYSKDIATSRKFDIIIIDEVDSLLLDNGLNTLYLSHDIAELEMLHPLLINIWNLVNIQLKNGSTCSNEDFYQSVYKTLFPVSNLENLAERLSITLDEAKEFQEILQYNDIIDANGTILVTRKPTLLQKFKNMEEKFKNLEALLKRRCKNAEIQETSNVSSGIAAMVQFCEFSLSFDAKGFKNLLIKDKIINNFGELIITDKESLCEKLEEIKNELNLKKASFIREFEKIIANLWLEIPEQLHSYVKSHLKDFITNAEIAYHMEEGIAYQVDLIKSSRKSNLKPKIVIIDRDSGVDLPTTQWHKGLHQFLQLKHGLCLTPLSTKAVFISNVSFLKMFECIYGFSGTLGAHAEKEQLMEIYKLPSIILPSSHVKLFYEEHSIVTKTPEMQYEEIFNVIRLRLDEGRSVLVVAESLKQVTSLHENITAFANGKLSSEEFESFKKAICYKRDSDIFEYGDGTIELPPRTIIFATTLAGRGTDIKLSEKLIARGGLHVIIAFLPRNVRIEEQAFGRAARCGEPGTAQLIIHDKNAISIVNIMELKWKRNATESQRVKQISEHYENKIISEENCFAEFSKKYKQLTKNINENKYVRTLLKDLLDQWALWLDSSEYIWKNKEARGEAAAKFCKELKINDQEDQPTRPLNILTYAIQKLQATATPFKSIYLIQKQSKSSTPPASDYVQK